MRKNFIALTAVAVLTVGALTGCSSSNNEVKETTAPTQAATEAAATEAAAETATLKDGDYQMKGAEDFGYIPEISMTVSGGKITAFTYEAYSPDGTKKSDLALKGEYVMNENGMNWAEQAKALADYVLANQSVDNLTLNEEGKTDAIAGVSVNITSFVELTKQIIAEASK